VFGDTWTGVQDADGKHSGTLSGQPVVAGPLSPLGCGLAVIVDVFSFLPPHQVSGFFTFFVGIQVKLASEGLQIELLKEFHDMQVRHRYFTF
jgi:hypothetical protein